MAKEVKISCEGADLAEIDELWPLQGDLKSMDDPDLESLILEITETGYAFPIRVWRLPTGRFYMDKKWIVGGHQTQIALLEMRKRGIKIPKLPITYVIASSEEDAKRRVLQDISQYGKVNEKSLFQFSRSIGTDILEKRFKIPEVSWPSFRAEFHPAPGKKVEFTAKASAPKEEQKTIEQFEHECPRCGWKFGEKTIMSTTILRKK